MTSVADAAGATPVEAMNPDFKAVASADFGTSGSGWAHALVDDPTNIIVDQGGLGTTAVASRKSSGFLIKQPTALLLKADDLSFVDFGKGAYVRYKQYQDALRDGPQNEAPTQNQNQSETQTKTQSETQNQTRSETQTQTQSETQTQTQAETPNQTQSERQTQTQSEARSGATGDENRRPESLGSDAAPRADSGSNKEQEQKNQNGAATAPPRLTMADDEVETEDGRRPGSESPASKRAPGGSESKRAPASSKPVCLPNVCLQTNDLTCVVLYDVCVCVGGRVCGTCCLTGTRWRCTQRRGIAASTRTRR
jgi:hypothetical protein